MKNILLINPTGPDAPPAYFGPPYGIALIAAVLEKNNKVPICLDFGGDSFDYMLKEIEKTIIKNKIKYLGISCQSSSRAEVYKLIEYIKKNYREIIIILGGPFATQKYELLLKNFQIDFIVLGDGEITLNELIETIEQKKDLREVNGIAYFFEGKLIKTKERERIENIDNLPFPAFHLFKVRENLEKKERTIYEESKKKKIFYFNKKKCMGMPNALMLLSSYGCIYGCSFCPMSEIFEKKYREHSPKYFVDMLEYFNKKYNNKYFVFGDNFFTKNMERTKEICNEIIKRKIKIEWNCMTRCDYIEKKLLKKMKKAGCTEISFGVESCSEKVQKTIGKNLKYDSVRNAFKLCNEIKIRTILMLMVGNQGETKETIYETLSKIKDLEYDEMLVKITKVYPGTKIHQLFEKEGLISDEFYLGTDANPPSFTLENKEETLNYFEKMFKLREIKIEIGGSCNNNCHTCLNSNKKKPKDTEELKKDMIRLSQRANTFTLFEKEPPIRKDFLELINYSKYIGINKIQIESNGRIFKYNKIVKKLKHLPIHKIIIHFQNFSQKEHDKITRTPDSFNQTISGIKNLCIYNPSIVKILIRINNKNYQSLEKSIKFLCSMGVNEFELNYDPTIMPSPPIKKIKPFLKKALYLLKSNKKNFCIMGIPYCAIQGYEEEIDEIHRTSEEKYTIENKLINIGKERRLRKYKKKRCFYCEYEKICEGFWKKNKNGRKKY